MEKPRPFTHENLEKAKDSIGYTPASPLGRYVADYIRDMHLPPLEKFRDKKILDLGPGTALRFARGLKERGIKADVISFSPAFSIRPVGRRAQNVLPDDEAGKLMVAGMGEELPFDNGVFDAVVCHSVVQYLDSMDRYISFLKENVRVLVPGGKAYFCPISDNDETTFQLIPKKRLEIILNNEATVLWKHYADYYMEKLYNLRLTKREQTGTYD